MAGQSNMGGAGNFDELNAETKLQLEELSERLHLLDKSNTVRPLSYGKSSFHLKKYGFENYFGPELFLGLTLAKEYPHQEFLFIKRSQGGTSLYGAWNPNWDSEKADVAENKAFKKNMKLCESHLTMIQNCIDSLRSNGKVPVIVGMYWMQGENDAAIEVCALAYKENLSNLIKHYRDYFELPNMPFIIGQINSTYGQFKDGPRIVRQSMEEVAAADQNTFIIKTSTDSTWSDFPKHFDNTHYNTEGQKRLGKAFAIELMNCL
ncbi:hypothetical protein NH26_22770 [Flammeovirga pacifica]|uniref:Sialate O-acetylesterase domain-containing protein n=2 Tax=Flammeovirga pacifica TaxID=915059 RepID=A0A1S1YTT3_FLAPC|nr:hypothetical protein NH26_22770 [Flammeovirga pacifica]